MFFSLEEKKGFRKEEHRNGCILSTTYSAREEVQYIRFAITA